MTDQIAHDVQTLQPTVANLCSRLPQLHNSTVALRNHVYGTSPSLLSNGRVFLWQDSGDFVTLGELTCRLGTAPITLAADNLSSLEPRLKGFESFVPTEACLALAEHALAPVLELIEQLAGTPLQCDDFGRGQPVADPTGSVQSRATEDTMFRFGFVLRPSGAHRLVRGWVRASAQTWRSLDFSRTSPLPARWPPNYHAVPTALLVQLGNCRLAAAELRDLKPGDALRITPRVPRQADGLPVLLTDAAGRFGTRACLVGDHLTLETAMTTLIETAEPTAARGPVPEPTTSPTVGPRDGQTASAPFEQADPLGDVACDLSFELGSLRMTVAEVAKLRNGQALRLGVRLREQPVRIMAAGRLIARGELAAVGDELVVLVTDAGRLPHV